MYKQLFQHPDFSFVAHGGIDGFIEIFDVSHADDRRLAERHACLDFHDSYVSKVKFLTIIDDEKINIHDNNDHDDDTTANNKRINNDNGKFNYIVSCSGDGTCILWDPDTQTMLNRFVCARASITDLVLFDLNKLFEHDNDIPHSEYDHETTNKLNFVDYSFKNCMLLACVSGDGHVYFSIISKNGKIFDQCIGKFQSSKNELSCLDISPNGKYIAVGSTDGYVRVYQIDCSILLDATRRQEINAQKLEILELELLDTEKYSASSYKSTDLTLSNWKNLFSHDHNHRLPFKLSSHSKISMRMADDTNASQETIDLGPDFTIGVDANGKRRISKLNKSRSKLMKNIHFFSNNHLTNHNSTIDLKISLALQLSMPHGSNASRFGNGVFDGDEFFIDPSECDLYDSDNHDDRYASASRPSKFNLESILGISAANTKRYAASRTITKHKQSNGKVNVNNNNNNNNRKSNIYKNIHHDRIQNKNNHNYGSNPRSSVTATNTIDDNKWQKIIEWKLNDCDIFEPKLIFQTKNMSLRDIDLNSDSNCQEITSIVFINDNTIAFADKAGEHVHWISIKREQEKQKRSLENMIDNVMWKQGVFPDTHTSVISSLSVNRNNKILASSGFDSTVALYDVSQFF